MSETKCVVVRGEAFDYHIELRIYVNVEDGSMCVTSPSIFGERLDFQRDVFERALSRIEAIEEGRREDIVDDDGRQIHAKAPVATHGPCPACGGLGKVPRAPGSAKPQSLFGGNGK